MVLYKHTHRLAAFSWTLQCGFFQFVYTCMSVIITRFTMWLLRGQRLWRYKNRIKPINVGYVQLVHYNAAQKRIMLSLYTCNWECLYYIPYALHWLIFHRKLCGRSPGILMKLSNGWYACVLQKCANFVFQAKTESEGQLQNLNPNV